MHIERIQVEEGFLDGLDLALKPGLNTLIGARGTGKTSIIELIRYCFGVAGHTAESNRRSQEHAVSILGGGQVIVTVRDGATSSTLSRSSNGAAKRERSQIKPPIVFSQTEIEAVALQPGGRLGLIDAFDSARTEDQENAVIAEVLSLTSQVMSIRREVEELQTSRSELPALMKQLSDLKPAEENLSRVSADASQKSQSVSSLTKELSAIAVADSAVERFRQSVERLRGAITDAIGTRSLIEEWPVGAGKDPLATERVELAEVQTILRAQALQLSELANKSRSAAEVLTGRRMPLEAQSRTIRKEIESLQSGAGEISRQGQILRERLAQIASLKQVEDHKQSELTALTLRRNQELDHLSDLREKRFQSRQGIAKSLNKSLGPRIRVTVERSGEHQTYAALVAEVLKGSGLRYNELAPLVARSMSPRELLEAAEMANFDLISEATGITRDRALRFVSALRDTELGRIGTVPLDDSVTLSLLDGKDYKSIEELSTGQRCTVVLPIVLRHVDRIVIVDQPEDHIDNAFIADTLIKAVSERDAKGQILFSTHNANIPVLGAADYVVQMGSDGHRGFPLVHDALSAPSVVNAISTVMEGGADAFRRRAAFYSGHNA
jgi:chromosome segregation ATPase